MPDSTRCAILEIMRVIDRKWTSLAEGYRAVLELQEKLEAEFGAALQAGRERRYHRVLMEWQKKRRIFIALAVFAPLSMITLCVTAYYFRSVACVIIYWAVVVLVILVTLSFALRQYLVEVVAGRPQAEKEIEPMTDLEQRWWKHLAPAAGKAEKAGRWGMEDFLSLLGRSLQDEHVAVPLSENGLLLAGPSGIWIFEVVGWNGRVEKEQGIWRQFPGGMRGKSDGEIVHPAAPDEAWLRLKQNLRLAIEQRLPQRAWMLAHIQGGVAFTHPQVRLMKARILESSASYGPARLWVERVAAAPAVEGFTLEMRLEVLDALADPGSPGTVSAKDEAQQLHLEMTGEFKAGMAEPKK